MGKKRVLLNFAHPLPGWLEKHWRIISIPFQVPAEVAADKNGTKLADFAAETVLKLAAGDAEVRAALNTGRFAWVPPGLSQAAVVLSAVLHGLCGHFPPVLWQVRGQEGFEPIAAPVDVQAYREQARAGRSFGAGVAALREVCPACGKAGAHDCEGEE